MLWEYILITYESLIFSSAFDLAIYSVFIAQFECPISTEHVLLVFSGCLNGLYPFLIAPIPMYSSSFIAVFIGSAFLSITPHS